MPVTINFKTSILNPSQREYILSDDLNLLFAGGYGAGKTLALCLKILVLIQNNPGCPGLIVSPNWRQMWSVVHRTLIGVLLKSGVPRKNLPKVIDKKDQCYLDFGAGTHVFLRSAHNLDGFEGTNAAWLAGDELRLWKRAAYNVAIARVRIKCPNPQNVFATTPSMGLVDEEFNSGKKFRKLITASTRENAHNLQPDYIENLRLSYSKRLQDAIIDGIFCVLEGAVFDAFDGTANSPWLIKYDFRETNNQRTWLAIDPGYRRSSVIWIRQKADLEWVVFHQMQLNNKPMSDVVGRINAWNIANGVHIDDIWVDPAADAKDQADHYNVMQILKSIDFRLGSPSIHYITGIYRSIPLGVEKTRALLGDPDNNIPIRVYFSRELYDNERGQERGIIKSATSYAYPDTKDGRPVTDHPVKDGVFDHAIDAFRYWVMGRWLSEPRLRMLDPNLTANRGTGQGFRIVHP